ncbi:MAG TPA: hypothetical protein VFH47_05170 [Candidatus Thermoplasmatota archaeon]|nr:hypothetical protein [Candidatus Thermoplasmatota archaeon]
MAELSVPLVSWSSLAAFLVTALFIYIAARIVIDRSGVIAALLTALVANLLAALVLQVVDNGTLAIILAVVVWALVAALFYRTSWLKGAVIGLVAWVLWLITIWVIGRI